MRDRNYDERLQSRLMRLRRILPVLLLLLACVRGNAQLTEVGDGGPGPFKAQHMTVELTSVSPAVTPGGKVTAGLVITLEEHWHVYWVNAGDSGEAPSVKWTAPAGVTVGAMQFPTPTRLPLGPLMDFGYEDTVAFPQEIAIAPTVKPGPVHLDAQVSWLVCREVCIPGKGHLGLNLNVQPGATVEQPAGALGAALQSLPRALPAGMTVAVTGGQKEFVLTVTGAHPGILPDDVEFYPFDQDQIVNAADQEYEAIPGGFRLRVARAEDPDHAGTMAKLPKTLHGLLKVSDGESYELALPVTPGEVAAVPKPAEAGKALTVLPAIGLALLGGILLNLMPCVFPVLFLKGLALVQSSGEERGRMRAHGFVYTLGILVSFWAIVAVLLGLRAAGSHIGWGFQLQSPGFVAVVASLLFFMALSLAGMFDVGLSLTSAGGDLAQKEGFAGSFFTGVLATVVATPCTAPLMGAAIGFALAQPVGVTFAVFTALGLGLALPYLALTLQPAWTRWLPRPGAWMETLKELTALPLFATVIWLVWTYGRLHAGGGTGMESDAIFDLLLCFLVLAVAGWVLGRWPGRPIGSVVAAALAIGALAIPLHDPNVVPGSTVPGGSVATGEPGLTWQPYSQATLEQARAEGHPVFIDFTAAWCLSCQVNEKLVLKSTAVEHELAARHFTLMRADWTQYAPAITSELATLGRSGVPTYVIYPAQGAPDVLPELLSKSVVLTEIDKSER